MKTHTLTIKLATVSLNEQEALLSQRGRATLRACILALSVQYFELLRLQVYQCVHTTKFCSVRPPSTAKNDAQACCHKQNSLMCGTSSSVCRDKQTPPLSAITLFRARLSSSHRSHSQILVENRDFCLSEGVPVGIVS